MRVVLLFVLVFGCYVQSDSDLNNDAVDAEHVETATISVKQLTTNSTSSSTQTQESAIPSWQKVLDDVGGDSDDDDDDEEEENPSETQDDVNKNENPSETQDDVNKNENPSSLEDDKKIDDADTNLTNDDAVPVWKQVLNEAGGDSDSEDEENLSGIPDAAKIEDEEPTPDSESGENVSNLKNNDVIMADDSQDKDLVSGTEVREQKNEEASQQSSGKLKDVPIDNAGESEPDAQNPNEEPAFQLDLIHQLYPEDQNILRDEEDDMNKPRNSPADSENQNGYEQSKDFDVIDYLMPGLSAELIDAGGDTEEERLVQREKLIDEGAKGQMVVILAVFCIVSLAIVFLTIVTVRKLKARRYSDRKMLIDEDEMYYFSI